MSETETAPASQTEEAPNEGVVFEDGDSATPEKQEPAAPVETSGEAPETVTPEKNETASETAEQPAESDAERMKKAEARDGYRDRRITRLEKENDRLRSAIPKEPAKPEPVPAKSDALKRPDRYDAIFEGDDARYDAALDKYEADRIDRAIGKDRDERDRERLAKSADEKFNSFKIKVDALAESDPEYDELASDNPDIQMSDLLRNHILDSDKGAEMHRHILKNPDALLRINDLSLQYPNAARTELAKIESSFANRSPGQSQPARTSTSAPDPIPIASGSSAPTGDGTPAGFVLEDE